MYHHQTNVVLWTVTWQLLLSSELVKQQVTFVFKATNGNQSPKKTSEAVKYSICITIIQYTAYNKTKYTVTYSTKI